MANTKISQLTANNNPTGNEELVYAYNNTNGKMSVNTMKTFIGSGKQDTLVSGTNIKTINNTSLLGSGNITISGGGGGGAGYDCVVDAGGAGDYTTVSAALTAGETSIFIKNGTYNETTQLLITTPNIVIRGESSDGVIINIEKSSTETANLGYVNFDSTGYTADVMGIIENLTLNFIIGKGNQTYYGIYASTKNLTRNVDINNCYINVVTKVSNANIQTSSMSGGVASNVLTTNICTFNNCIFNVVAHSSVTPSDVSCRFYIGGVKQTRTELSQFNSCQFNMEKTGHMWMYIRGNCDGCNFWIEGDDNNSIAYLGIGGNNKGCYFDCSGYCRREISGTLTGCIVGNRGDWYKDNTQATAVKNAFSNGTLTYWVTSTSYSVGDVVVYQGALYYCTEAHTSSTFIDYDKFDEYMAYTSITNSASITNSYLGLGGDTVIENEQNSQPGIGSGAIGVLSNNNIETREGNIYILGRRLFTGNVISSTSYNKTYDVYTFDNCVLSGNFFNFGTAGHVGAIGYNNALVGNMLNAYSGTPTITVESGQNNVLGTDNVISSKIF